MDRLIENRFGVKLGVFKLDWIKQLPSLDWIIENDEESRHQKCKWLNELIKATWLDSQGLVKDLIEKLFEEINGNISNRTFFKVNTKYLRTFHFLLSFVPCIGQIILKQNCRAATSPKKRTKLNILRIFSSVSRLIDLYSVMPEGEKGRFQLVNIHKGCYRSYVYIFCLFLCYKGPSINYVVSRGGREKNCQFYCV